MAVLENRRVSSRPSTLRFRTYMRIDRHVTRIDGTTINEKEVMNLKERKGGGVGALGGKKGKGQMMQL